MLMKKTLFTKYLGMTCLILAGSFCILGLLMVTLSSNDWRDSQKSNLTRLARSVSTIVSNGMTESDGTLALDTARLEMLLPSLSKNNECDLLLTDTCGRILAMSRGSNVRAQKGTPCPLPRSPRRFRARFTTSAPRSTACTGNRASSSASRSASRSRKPARKRRSPPCSRASRRTSRPNSAPIRSSSSYWRRSLPF